LTKNKIFKNIEALLIIFILLCAGVVFVYFLQKGIIYEYIENKYYHPQVLKIRPAKLVKIGFVTDAHTMYKKGALKKSTTETLDEFSKQMNIFRPDFIIDGGDMIEGTKRVGNQSITDFQAINQLFSQAAFGASKYYVLGNHELRGFNRQKWLELTGMENSYYYFDVDNLRVIVLDGNFMPSSVGDIAIEPGLYYTRGYVNNEQKKWLEKVLENSVEYRKIVFLHQPPLDSTNHKTGSSGFPAGAAKLRAIFSQYGVSAVFSGHIEEAYHEKIDGVDYFIVPGFWKDNDDKEKGHDFYKRVFSEIKVRRNVSLKMHYKDLESGEYKILEL
jgi:3',5'-cyclic AMP phosphodiesterase CpdA